MAEGTRKILWPQLLTDVIEHQLDKLGYGLHQLDKLAPYITQISDSYNSDKNSSPWKSKALQASYLAYFFPLNVLRLISVINEGQRLGFFKSIKTATEIGSGCGAFDMAYSSALNIPLRKHNLEISKEAIYLHKEILSKLPTIKSEFTSSYLPGDLFVASYTLNEIEDDLPDLQKYDNLLIIEPSTEKHSRKLIELRESLIKQGYHAWAPCPHNLDCPILKNTKKDWCHDRVFIEKPPWFLKLENRLPNFNNSLTFSYLLMSKRPSPIANKKLIRTIGNTLKEKGKHKQMICTNDERLFFSWLKKHGKPQFLNRGALYNWPQNFEEKSNEIRPESDVTEHSYPDE